MAKCLPAEILHFCPSREAIKVSQSVVLYTGQLNTAEWLRATATWSRQAKGLVQPLSRQTASERVNCSACPATQRNESAMNRSMCATNAKRESLQPAAGSSANKPPKRLTSWLATTAQPQHYIRWWAPPSLELWVHR